MKLDHYFRTMRSFVDLVYIFQSNHFKTLKFLDFEILVLTQRIVISPLIGFLESNI